MKNISFDGYKRLVRIRVLMNMNPSKAKQLLTDIIKKYEIANFGGVL